MTYGMGLGRVGLPYRRRRPGSPGFSWNTRAGGRAGVAPRPALSPAGKYTGSPTSVGDMGKPGMPIVSMWPDTGISVSGPYRQPMAYPSVDVLQNILATEVFHYTKDSKKAAGRALGTLVEIIAFYLLKSWGYEKSTAIERRIPEYGNPAVTHNVEFTLHSAVHLADIRLHEAHLPFTAKKIHRHWQGESCPSVSTNKTLLSKNHVLRNSCTMYEDARTLSMAYLGDKKQEAWNIAIERLSSQPFAMVECKRVGVEAGMKKGPQTIEKAKQGAYVAKSVSSLQKIRKRDGVVYGVLPLPDNSLRVKPYGTFMDEILDSPDQRLPSGFILTVGVVSNHGNWFTSNDHNKELAVLAQSYDWLLFLSDEGLSAFIEQLLLHPCEEYQAVKTAFIDSYTGDNTGNKFTKVRIRLSADRAMQHYFRDNLEQIERWFNVIAPLDKSLPLLRSALDALAHKHREETP